MYSCSWRCMYKCNDVRSDLCFNSSHPSATVIRVSIVSDNGLLPNHYLNQCWIIVNWNLRNKLRWNINQDTNFVIHENASEDIVCKNHGGHFVRGRWVNLVVFMALKRKTRSIQCYGWWLFCPLLLICFNLIPAWISNYVHDKVWNEMTYTLPNFSGCTVEVWEWISNFIPHFTGHMIAYSCWD